MTSLPDLWLNGWAQGRTAPLLDRGPEGAEGLMDGLLVEVLSPAMADTITASFPPGRARRIEEVHVTVDQAARLFAEAEPSTAGYHRILAPLEGDDRLAERTRAGSDAFGLPRDERDWSVDGGWHETVGRGRKKARTSLVEVTSPHA